MPTPSASQRPSPEGWEERQGVRAAPGDRDLNSGKGRKNALPDRCPHLPGRLHGQSPTRAVRGRRLRRSPGPAWRSAGLAANPAKLCGLPPPAPVLRKRLQDHRPPHLRGTRRKTRRAPPSCVVPIRHEPRNLSPPLEPVLHAHDTSQPGVLQMPSPFRGTLKTALARHRTRIGFLLGVYSIGEVTAAVPRTVSEYQEQASIDALGSARVFTDRCAGWAV